MASDLPVDLLEDIFLRLDDTADLARASAACTSFRRVISDGRFLRHRRFRSLHRRPVLGLLLDDRHYKTGLFRPAQSPRQRRQAACAASFAKAADFTFSFLPDRSRWRVCDARDGRVLLTRCRGPHYTFEDLVHVVYDPLHRRHVQIPTIPGDLILSCGNDEAMTFDDPFLAPVAGDERDDGEGFRVMCTALSRTKIVVALVFSSASGQWQCVASFSNPSVASFSNPSCAWTNIPKIWSRQYVHSCRCFCWTNEDANDMLVFDTRVMKFSITDLPRKSYGKFKMAVEAGDGRLGLVFLRNHSKVDLYSKAWQGIQEPEEGPWQRDGSSVPVRGVHLMLAGAAEGYVLLRGIPTKQRKLCKAHYFIMDLKTLLVEKLCVVEYKSHAYFLWASLPPPLSSPMV